MKKMHPNSRWGLLIVAFISLTGCRASGPHPTPASDTEIAQSLLAFLRDGSTTKEEAILKLGAPAAVFESERILTYRFRHTREEGMSILGKESPPSGTWEAVQYSLVLVFDAQQVLQKHNLVLVK